MSDDWHLTDEAYREALSEQYQRGWTAAIEAAAELMAGNVVGYSTDDPPKLVPVIVTIDPEDNMEGCVRAAAIRKLRK